MRNGQCSALVSIDPVSQKEMWRTPPLISNDLFLVQDGKIICGYGFTSEEDYLHILDAASGRLISRTHIDSAHDYLEMQNGSLVVVSTTSVYRFQLP